MGQTNFIVDSFLVVVTGVLENWWAYLFWFRHCVLTKLIELQKSEVSLSVRFGGKMSSHYCRFYSVPSVWLICSKRPLGR